MADAVDKRPGRFVVLFECGREAESYEDACGLVSELMGKMKHVNKLTIARVVEEHERPRMKGFVA